MSVRTSKFETRRILCSSWSYDGVLFVVTPLDNNRLAELSVVVGYYTLDWFADIYLWLGSLNWLSGEERPKLWLTLKLLTDESVKVD